MKKKKKPAKKNGNLEIIRIFKSSNQLWIVLEDSCFIGDRAIILNNKSMLFIKKFLNKNIKRRKLCSKYLKS